MWHAVTDCTSFVRFMKEWARESRGDHMVDAFTLTSWERLPHALFSHVEAPTPPSGMYLPTGKAKAAALSATSATTMMCFHFSKGSLQQLKEECKPSEHGAWVSTGDCVAAILWRALTRARSPKRQANRDIHFNMAVDGRSRCKHPDAENYFGNLLT